MGASGSELSISEATTSATVRTKKSTSIRRRPSSTHHHQRLNSCVPPHTGMTSPRSSRHHGVTEVKLSEATGGTSVQIETPILTDKFPATSRLNPVTAKEESNPRPFKTSLKRCKSIFTVRFYLLKYSLVLCIPSCISDKDMVG